MKLSEWIAEGGDGSWPTPEDLESIGFAEKPAEDPVQLLRELRSVLFCVEPTDRIKELIARINAVEDLAELERAVIEASLKYRLALHSDVEGLAFIAGGEWDIAVDALLKAREK
jgi:hypothetical protein